MKSIEVQLFKLAGDHRAFAETNALNDNNVLHAIHAQCEWAFSELAGAVGWSLLWREWAKKLGAAHPQVREIRSHMRARALLWRKVSARLLLSWEVAA